MLRRVRAFAACLALLGLAACGGGGGSSGAAPPAATGRLAVAGCEIAESAASCAASVSWTTAGAAAAGTIASTVGLRAVTVTLLDGAAKLDEATLTGACLAATAWDGAGCRRFAVKTTERAPTSFFEGGKAVSLEVVIYRPPGDGPFPAIAFHHGSTGNGDDPSLFRVTYTSEAVAKFFADRGILVAFGQRRGRGASDGLYDEGFEPNRSRYSCSQGPALAGLERALQDADAIATYLAARPDVDPARLLGGGTSRGGILAMAHAARRQAAFVGVVNFVGGWLGEGCADSVAVNRSTFAAAAAYPGPTLWLYGENDSFYSVAHSRANFAAFESGGGHGAFHLYTRARPQRALHRQRRRAVDAGSGCIRDGVAAPLTTRRARGRTPGHGATGRCATGRY